MSVVDDDYVKELMAESLLDSIKHYVNQLRSRDREPERIEVNKTAMSLLNHYAVEKIGVESDVEELLGVDIEYFPENSKENLFDVIYSDSGKSIMKRIKSDEAGEEFCAV